MTFYQDSNFPISEQTDKLHRAQLLSFSEPGTWGSATMRRAIAAEARKARCEAGAQESIGDEPLAETAQLPEAARRLARAVAHGGIEIDRAFCEQTQADGVTEGAYVEIVGIVARVAHLDVFARGVGIPSRPLGEAVEEREPTFARPAEATKEGFFTASIPNAPAGGEVAKALFGQKSAPNILRSLSLVPDEARRLIAVITEEYYSTQARTDLTYSPQAALSRPQLEFVAARVSALNQCFY
jgi:hypothetical protein